VAIAVDPSLAPGLLANTVAALAIGLGSALPVLGAVPLTDYAGRRVLCSANRPVPVLEAGSEILGSLLLKALPAPEGAVVVPFPAFARPIHGFEDYLARFPRVDLASEAIEGLALAGPERWVRSLTGSLKLLR
jgi:hypothetical protein